MAQSAASPDNKKRKLTSIINHKETPQLFLNVGGAKRNIRRSVWNALRDASCGGKTPSLGQGGVEAKEEVEFDSSGSQNQGNPLCDLVLKGAAHWSDVPTTSDDDGTIRIYLDRNPQALDDLLEYIEYGKVFLKGLISKDDNGARLERLQMECDYFTVNTLMKDVDDVMFGEAVSFRADGWFRIAGDCLRDEDGDAVNWNWRNVCGNESIATRNSGNGRSISICDVKTTGTYLMFFSLHSVAVTALSPTQFYTKDCTDEFVQVSMFHEVMTKSEDGHWAFPLVRCGAFDYRDNEETRENEPLLFTAAFAEPVSLKKGNRLYCSHGYGIMQPWFMKVNDQVVENSFFSLEEPHCLNFITLVRVFGDSIARWSVKCERDPNSEHSIIKWLPAQDDFPRTSQGAILDENDETKIRFRKAGYYLLLGRVAARLKKKFNTNESKYYGTVRLELRTNGGLPLHIDAEVVSYPNNFNEDLSFNNKMAEYGPINDIIYAESDSYISVRATTGACFARHGTAPSPFGVDKIPTQSLSAIRLDYNMRVDRYQVSLYQNKVSYKRALGGEESVPNQAPLFVAADDRDGLGLLKALEDCRCIVIGCLSCKMGDTVSLYKNNDAIIHSQLCEGSGHGYGSHTLNTVVEIKANDTFVIKSRGSDVQSGGHLAFLTLQ